jgi:hypothetical protein
MDFRSALEERYGPGWPDAPDILPPVLTTEERGRLLLVFLRGAANAVKMPPADKPFSSVADFLRCILERAREHKMDAALYERVWGMHRIFKEHDCEVSPQ